MLNIIDNFIPPAHLERVGQILSSTSFQDGRLTAGSLAGLVKQNEEVSADSTDLKELNEIVMGLLVRQPEYRAICWPKRIATPFYARYEAGMQYGEHVDDPVMGQDQIYRADISFTIFLSPKDSYQGGELRIIENYGEQRIKLDAGSVVFYPSSSLHSVLPVTSGTRYVAVSWIQSTIRDAGKRQLLYELNQAREILIKEQPGSEACNKLSNSFNNLVRRWVEL
jgi:PKHD-type hydroxylase